MYDNNDNYSQQSNMSGSSNNGYHEYYYSAGNVNGTYGQTIDATPGKKPKKSKGFGKKIASVICLGLVFGVAAGAAFSVPAYLTTREMNQTKLELQQMQAELTGNATSGQSSLSTTADSLSTSKTAYNATNTSDVAAIAESCLPSVVSITNKGLTEVRTMFGTYQQDTESSGSGIIIGENDTELLIVTNYHVISGSNDLSVVFSYDEDSDEPSLVSAKVKGYVSDKDLAVIAVSLDDITDEMRSKIKIATIGDSSKLVLGQEVVAIGNALGYGQSVTTGIISALNREVTVSDENGGTITNKLIQTDAAINPGNSGGALLNMNGELIGINSVKVSSSSVEGMGYAIPITSASPIIADLMERQTRTDKVAAENMGYMGISLQEVNSQISQMYNMPQGIYVVSVEEGSAAQTAGIMNGDIITKFDGSKITSYADLQNVLQYYAAGDSAKITLMRPENGQYVQYDLEITLGSRPAGK